MNELRLWRHNCKGNVRVIRDAINELGRDIEDLHECGEGEPVEPTLFACLVGEGGQFQFDGLLFALLVDFSLFKFYAIENTEGLSLDVGSRLKQGYAKND